MDDYDGKALLDAMTEYEISFREKGQKNSSNCRHKGIGMFDKYSIYYSYKEIGDVLLIVFDQKAMPTSFIQKSDVTVIYHNGEIIGYNIFNISKIVKINQRFNLLSI